MRLFILSLGMWAALLASSCATPVAINPAKAPGGAIQEGSHFVGRDLGPGSPAVIFLHGVLGDSRTTWLNGNNAYWPSLLSGDTSFAGATIYVHQYDTFLLRHGLDSLSIDELASDLKVRLDADRVTEHESLVFIVHSMGGLVVRDFLLKYRDIADKTRFIFFLATPTTGASIAQWAALVSRNPEFQQMRLMKSSDFLADMQRNWLDAGFGTAMPSYCAYETRRTYGNLIVDQASAGSLCNKALVPIEGADHIDIAKPANTKALQYAAFENAYRSEATIRKLTLVNRGLGHLSQNLWDAAIEDFTGALRIDAGYLPAIRNLGAAYLGKGSYDPAIDVYEKAIKLEPDNAEHFYNLGAAYFDRPIKPDYGKAIANFRTAIDLNFYDKALAYYFLGLAKKRGGDPSGGQAAIEEARRIDPDIGTRPETKGVTVD